MYTYAIYLYMAHMYIYIYIFVCMYIYICTNIDVFIHICVCIYIYMYILKRLPPLPPTSTQTRGFIALVPVGLHWSSQGPQMSYLAFLCGREHRFEEICWIPGQGVGQPVAPCGGLGQGVGRPVAACCNRVDPL